jgi:uncharacterized membrane protein
VSHHLVDGVLAIFALTGLMVTAPWWWKFVDMGVTATSGYPFAQFTLKFALPAILLAAILALGIQRGVFGG